MTCPSSASVHNSFIGEHTMCMYSFSLEKNGKNTGKVAQLSLFIFSVMYI